MPNRPLTTGEIALTKSVFGRHINLSSVRLKTACWVLKGYAVSPNGYIYFHKDDFCADFSVLDVYKKAWLIHELTHIWQYQQGMQVFWRTVFNRRYAYTLGKPFLTYGIEQQARIVEDYYLKRELGKNCDDLASCIIWL